MLSGVHLFYFFHLCLLLHFSPSNDSLTSEFWKCSSTHYVQDHTVLIWTKDSATAPWVSTALDPSTISSTVPSTAAPAGASSTEKGKFPDVVWRVSWSLAGNVLAVSCGDGKVTLWKESLKGTWECVSELAG